jgi:hypothetical protein
MALNTLYEHMYDFGKMLQTDKCLSVFAKGFRPWPHLYLDRGRAKKFYKGRQINNYLTHTMTPHVTLPLNTLTLRRH